ncbi:MAG: coproporphyrinogen dehydrogenase HemZ [Fusobacteriia bacterium 4572_132]|nr:MAG: coproporphyrinogen dehydrogenase HemZ [Fusobacteriia bacterium 4572_132]
MVKLNFEMRQSSFEEFIRVLIAEAKEDEIEIKAEEKVEKIRIIAKNEKNEITFEYKNIKDKIENQREIMAKIALLKLYNKEYRWGGLKGVRPTKVVIKLLELGFSIKEIDDILEKLYLVKKEKRELLLNVVEKELPFLNDEYVNVYIGIPYCPTKCTYCSFASYIKKGKMKEYYPVFLEKLNKEIKLISDVMKEKNMKIGSIYIGGGTPTILNEEELENLLIQIKNSFDLSNSKEFTLEAGRVDTITEKKLEIAKKYGVNRISINPQTFNKETLKKVNREGSIEEIRRFFDISYKIGFIINMDFIIGLVDEDTEKIIETIEKIREYDLDNLTIHNLALKRASKLYQEGYRGQKLNYKKIEESIKKVITEKEMYPYYMYRQKNSFDWGENLGKNSFFYNI